MAALSLLLVAALVTCSQNENKGTVPALPTATTVTTPPPALPVPPPAISVQKKSSASTAGTTLKRSRHHVADGEAAAYAKAYHNAERANQLLGEERYVTHPPDFEKISAHWQVWATYTAL